MYCEAGEYDAGVLKQGDILSKIHLLGAININAIAYAYSTPMADKCVGWQINNEPKFGDAIVLSHSCELDPLNEVKLTSIILAPLRDINTATPKDKIDALKSSNIVTENIESFLKFFCLNPNEKLEFKEGAVVDFSLCFSLRKNNYEYLTSKKILQLKSATAKDMARKLALFFSR